MWRHITGVEQPAKKIKLDNNEKLERKRTYDQVKRKRKFETSCQKNRNEERMSVLSSLETSSSPASPSSCRKKHIVCKLNMSFGLFHCCELTSFVFSASLFFFFF
jgi:hypothetical protein